MTTAAAANASEIVTVVVRRPPRRGREADYDAWLSGVIAAATTFPGHLGATVLRDDSRAVTLLFRFASVADLARWEQSPERAIWVARADALVEGGVHVARLTGLETWFRLPGGGTVLPPPRWKMALVSFCVAFPLIQGLSWLATRLLSGVPTLARGALVGATMILTMTYAAMPLATRLARRWLYPSFAR